ncbi:dihydroorotase family protein [Chloroflexota bacterium]
MAQYDLLIKGGRIVIPRHGEVMSDIGIKDGRFTSLAEDIDPSQASKMIDAEGMLVFPGAIDGHYHFGIHLPLDEDVTSGSEAAVLNGVTTVISYFRTGHDYLDKTGPYRTIFPEVLKLSENASFTDYCYHLGIITREQLDEIPMLVEEYGVSGFKYWMFYKIFDVRATGAIGREYLMSPEPCDLGHLYLIMRKVAEMNEKYKEHGTIRVSVHCEEPELIRIFLEEAKNSGMTGLRAFSHSRPGFCEKVAILETATLANEVGCPLILLHLSSREAIEAVASIAQLYPRLDVRTEVTPHHLGLTIDTVAAGVWGKINPPLRESDDINALWEAIKSGSVDIIGSDYAAHLKEEQVTSTDSDVWSAPLGLGSSPFYPLLLTEGYLKRGVPLTRIAELAALNPATCHSLYPKKGSILIGADADLAIIDLDMEKTISPEVLKGGSGFTVFAGMKLKGWPVYTIIRGKVVFRNGKTEGKPGYGQYVKRPVGLHYPC